MTCCPWVACYYILNKTAAVPTSIRNYILSKGREFERKMLRSQRNSVNTELRFQERKRKIVSNCKIISNTLKSMRHDKNTAPAEDFIMRVRLLYSPCQKNYFLIASAYFTYIMSQILCGHATAWGEFRVRDNCASSHFHQKTVLKSARYKNNWRLALVNSFLFLAFNTNFKQLNMALSMSLISYFTLL